MLQNYVKLAIKVLGRRKVFTFISLFGITLTLAVLMVTAALLDNFFAPRQPESRFDRVLGVYAVGLYGPTISSTRQPGYRFVDKYVRGLPGAEETSIFTIMSPVVMYHDGRRIETHIRRTDGAYWRILDFDFIEGGPFTEDDNRNASFVAVITDDMRQQLYGGAPAVGRKLTIDGQTFRVVGVVRAVPITRLVGFSEVWAPVRTLKTSGYEQQWMGEFGAIVLARSRADFPAIRREFRQRLSAFVFDDPRFNEVVAGLDTTFEAVARMVVGNRVQQDRAMILRGVFVLLALLFITLPTMNLVSINLSRIMERASEIGIRKAFGASSRALIAQFVMENVVLTAIGGLLGFAASVIILKVLSRAEVLPYAVFDVNLRIFFYGLALAAIFGVISGVYPAWRMSRMQPVDALRGGAL
jgi:putative ABC transport system permease protein